jgi:hypothetical protein
MSVARSFGGAAPMTTLFGCDSAPPRSARCGGREREAIAPANEAFMSRWQRPGRRHNLLEIWETGFVLSLARTE